MAKTHVVLDNGGGVHGFFKTMKKAKKYIAERYADDQDSDLFIFKKVAHFGKKRADFSKSYLSNRMEKYRV